MLKSLATRAAAGDVRASALLLPLIMQIFGIEDRGQDRRQLSQQDQAILAELLAGTRESVPQAGDDDARKLDVSTSTEVVANEEEYR